MLNPISAQKNHYEGQGADLNINNIALENCTILNFVALWKCCRNSILFEMIPSSGIDVGRDFVDWTWSIHGLGKVIDGQGRRERWFDKVEVCYSYVRGSEAY